MSFFQNTCKPKGIGGKIMVHMMNTGHSSMAEWGFTHMEIQSDNAVSYTHLTLPTTSRV